MRIDLTELRRYSATIQAHPKPTRELETSLVRRAQRGDKRARNLLVEHNLAFVIWCVLRVHAPGGLFHDLVQEGCLGILKAVEKFQPGRRLRFTTYARWWIEAFMLRYAKTSSWGVVKRRDVQMVDANLDMVADLPAWDPTPEEAALQSAREERVRHDVARLGHRLQPMGWDLVHSRLSSDNPDTLDAIGKRHGVSRERVRQIETQVKALLRRVLDEAA